MKNTARYKTGICNQDISCSFMTVCCMPDVRY